MEVGCGAATTVAAAAAAAADPSTRCGHSSGTLHRAGGVWKGQVACGLWCWVMEMMEEVMRIAVAVTVTVSMLRATGLLGGRGLQAAGVCVAQGQVTGGRASTRRVLLAAGWESGHGSAHILSCCARQTWSAVV